MSHKNTLGTEGSVNWMRAQPENNYDTLAERPNDVHVHGLSSRLYLT